MKQEDIDRVLQCAQKKFDSAVESAKKSDDFNANARFYELLGMHATLRELGEKKGADFIFSLAGRLMDEFPSA